MILKRFTSTNFLLISMLIRLSLLLDEKVHGFSNRSSTLESSVLHRTKRVTEKSPKGFFFPIAMYTVRHHRPAPDRGRFVRPETWEYRGQYFYGYKPRANSNRRQAARLLAAGLPLLLAPLLSILFSFPVLVPTIQTSTLTGGTTVLTGGALNGPFGPSPWIGRKRKRRKRRRIDPTPQKQTPENLARLKELEVVSNYLQQIDYDEKQQSRVMVNYLHCNGLLDSEDHCLERLSCEFGDPANLNAPELERTVTSILLGHMLNNEFIPRPFKKRLKSAAVFGKKNSGKCKKYFCHYVDNNWEYTNTYPNGGMQTHSPSPKRKLSSDTRLPPQQRVMQKF